MADLRSMLMTGLYSDFFNQLLYAFFASFDNHPPPTKQLEFLRIGQVLILPIKELGYPAEASAPVWHDLKKLSTIDCKPKNLVR